MNDRFKFRVWTDNMCDDCYMEYLDEYDTIRLTRTENLMQCTGLKDKNGKLIYEGDILEFSMFGTSYVRVVEYDEAILGIRLEKTTTNTSLIKFTIMNNLNVLGNIYENPELLEK